MHKAQREYCQNVKSLFPRYFQAGKRVIDVGSLDINGNNRYLFKSPETYIGVDIMKGPNVDFVFPIHQYPIGMAGIADVVISTEMLEHDKYWEQSLLAMYNILSNGGLLLITCASTGRKEHGTKRSEPKASPATNGYYQNISEEMFLKVSQKLDFTEWNLQINAIDCDLYFYGVKQ